MFLSNKTRKMGGPLLESRNLEEIWGKNNDNGFGYVD